MGSAPMTYVGRPVGLTFRFYIQIIRVVFKFENIFKVILQQLAQLDNYEFLIGLSNFFAISIQNLKF